MRKPIIVGLGGLGRAIFDKCKSAGLEPESFDLDKSKRPTKDNLIEALTDHSAIFMCMPTRATAPILAEAAKSKKDLTYVSFGKGVNEQGKSAAEILNGGLQPNEWVFVGGPLLPGDMTAGKEAFAVVASKDDGAAQVAVEILEKINVYTVRSNTPESVSLCGVLKNIYTIAFGIAVGLRLSDNLCGALWAGSLAEIDVILRALSVPVPLDNSLRLALFGDLFACDISQSSRHKLLGIELGSGGPTIDGDGALAAEFLRKRLDSNISELPILKSVADIIARVAMAQSIKQAVLLHYGR